MAGPDLIKANFRFYFKKKEKVPKKIHALKMPTFKIKYR
jgi:hypothetical protein